jgi:beta-mannosidase
MQARALLLCDEGLNGLALNAVNDSEEPLSAELELQLLRNGSVRVATGSKRLEIAARDALEVNGAELFEHFIDLTHAYRFGARQYDVAVAILRDATTGALIADACHFPGRLSPERVEDLGLESSLSALSGDHWQLRMSCKRFAHAVAVDVPGFTLEDSYFNLIPGSERLVSLHARVPGALPKGFLYPLNAQGPTRITVVPRQLHP